MSGKRTCFGVRVVRRKTGGRATWRSPQRAVADHPVAVAGRPRQCLLMALSTGRSCRPARALVTTWRAVGAPLRTSRSLEHYRWARGTHDRHRPGPGRGTAGERRHGGAAGRSRSRRVRLPLRDHRRRRRPVAAAGRPGRLGQRSGPTGPGAGRRDRPRTGSARDGGPRQRLGRPQRRPDVLARSAAARYPPPAASRPADPGQCRQPGALARRPRPRGGPGRPHARTTGRSAHGGSRVPRRAERTRSRCRARSLGSAGPGSGRAAGGAGPTPRACLQKRSSRKVRERTPAVRRPRSPRRSRRPRTPPVPRAWRTPGARVSRRAGSRRGAGRRAGAAERCQRCNRTEQSQQVQQDPSAAAVPAAEHRARAVQDPPTS